MINWDRRELDRHITREEREMPDDINADLLIALEAAIRWIGRLTDWEGAGDPDIDAWRAAIAKARGDAR